MAKLTLEQFRKKINSFAKDNPKAVTKALATGGIVVAEEAQVNHMSGPTSAGGGFFNESLSIGSGADRAGGNLRSSVTVRIKEGNNPSAKVGTNVVYAAVHEFGHGPIPRRPYLRPALEEKREEILDLMLRKLMEAYRRGV